MKLPRIPLFFEIFLNLREVEDGEQQDAEVEDSTMSRRTLAVALHVVDPTQEKYS